ncbi:MAG TPA: 5-amino-6-(D-ribitylamino)uracil--L-tyrosine 4-hydroxyphenyl transferase CofH [Spongiibacteraceae bacterium]|jgi:FO synthase|nr:5-amino-6-(D-ribitylamino)uracil--L-tyrosine 4-hydroxyphenyl transferase CofH [Spongiibacteraceae bacterium]HUH38635.1 5-amino-6-(D-ribitylamino)uracil--L-tyrosine 4-hydroxyphenyl transferase CofH [Spongiibacteraceae bacterium]
MSAVERQSGFALQSVGSEPAARHDALLAELQAQVLRGELLSEQQALALAELPGSPALLAAAGVLRDAGFGSVVTYSRKVFIPLTHLCRDVCHYCTFAKTPRRIEQAYLSADDVVAQVKAAEKLGCKEALFTLGERPELRYRAAREALDAMGFTSTLDYLAHVAQRVRDETGVLPHLNPGCMSAEELALLRPVSASMGIMLESASERLCEKGMPHHGSPDKLPARRLATLELAGEARVPFTSGILIGIGETRRERIESLLALRAVHQRHGHLQEVIVQNFRAKPDTKMAHAPEPDLAELLWTLAVARLVFGPDMSIQAPPNLSPGVLEQLVAAGINDWGGVSPVTPDYVNPEAPWPHLDDLAQATARAGKLLQERLTIYPRYAQDPARWLDPVLHTPVLRLVDGAGFPRTDDWLAGISDAPPSIAADTLGRGEAILPALREVVAAARAGQRLDEARIDMLFSARGEAFNYVCAEADALRRERSGDTVRYVVNRNINYTNICYFKCKFCAFSKGKHSENLRGTPYDLELPEIQRRVSEAWARGATEVCLQGGIHPDYTGETYLQILAAVKQAAPAMHVHAFSPLEVWQGAATLGIPLADFLAQLKAAGLGTLPGTAAEILDDEVRAVLCPDKLNTAQWLEVMETAHGLGLRTTATIMFGHVDGYRHWARHLLRVRDLQARTGGFTEFVPLAFVAPEAPMYLRGRSRRGPSWREAVLMHAVARLVLNGEIDNIQASWVKLSPAGAVACLRAGANDLGGTLMNESITRAAGAAHGQELPPAAFDDLIVSAGRRPAQRTTLYGTPPAERVSAAYAATELSAIVNTPPRRRERGTGVIATD